MSGKQVAISVQGVGKSYTLTQQREQQSTLAETLLQRIRRPFSGWSAPRETFWALRDMSFEIEQGEVVGVIGRNGAGKSTLLKILSRITEPSSGEINLYGRVGSLLEVGTGFHPELTGRENIYLNGAILGMKRGEITRQFDAIVDFAGVAQFLETPVKRYSSGMYVRLAFAVAAHLESEILLVDEVLAVGDAEFQRKCLGKMKDVARSGRTVLFVSHHMQSVHVLCDTALYLEKGRAVYHGDVSGAIDLYLGSFASAAPADCDAERRPGTGELRFAEVTAAKEAFACGDEKILRFRVVRKKPIAGRVFVSCLVINEMGIEVAQCDSRLVEFWMEADDEMSGEFVFRTPWLKPGDYRVDFFLCSSGILDRFENACRLHVMPLLPYSVAANAEATHLGLVFPDFTYRSIE